MSLANVGLKPYPPGAKISGAVQLTDVLDMENLSNMIVFSPKSVRRARGGFSSLIRMLASRVFSTTCGSWYDESSPPEYSRVFGRFYASTANRWLRRPTEAQGQ